MRRDRPFPTSGSYDGSSLLAISGYAPLEAQSGAIRFAHEIGRDLRLLRPALRVAGNTGSARLSAAIPG
jgi:hypothetical protein